MLRLHFVGLLLCVGTWVELQANTAFSQTSAQNPASCSVSIYGDGSAIIVPVVHRKRTYRFLIDTGSAHTVLDPTAFRHLTAMTADDSPAIPQSTVENPGDLRVDGKVLIKTPKLNLLDLSPYEVPLGETIHGILGCDFLNDYVVHINGDAGQIVFADATFPKTGTCFGLIQDEFRRPTISIPLTERANGASKHVFLIDTGSVSINGIVLQQDVFQACVDQGLLVVEGNELVEQATGRKVERAGTLQRLTIWKTFEQIQVRATAGYQQNLIGLSYLMQFNLTFDFPNSKMYVEPRKDKLDLSHLKDCCGLGIGREESNIFVKYLKLQSPAAKAGLREGDILLSVNGVPGEQIRLFPLRKSFCAAGQTVSLEVRRGAKQFKLNFQLEDWRRPVTAKDFE